MNLQLILGADKKNPYFNICTNPEEPTLIYIYFGAALLSVVHNDSNSFEFKQEVARLFNANVNRKKLKEIFKVSYNTMKRWGDALKTGNPVIIIKAFSGQGGERKITTEIRAYIVHRFNRIYKNHRHNYSSIIREELLEVFNLKVTSETLRPIFNELKKN